MHLPDLLSDRQDLWLLCKHVHLIAVEVYVI